MTEEERWNGLAERYKDQVNGSVASLSGADAEYFAKYKVDIILRHNPKLEKILDLGCGIGMSAKYFEPAISMTGGGTLV